MLLKEHDPKSVLCEGLGVPRRSASSRARPGADRRVRDALVELAGEWPTSGDRRRTVLLQRQGHAVNTQPVRRRRHELGIAGEAPRRVPRTTDSDHASPRFANLVEGLEVERPDQVWVADLTSVRLKEEFISLAVIEDCVTSQSVRAEGSLRWPFRAHFLGNSRDENSRHRGECPD
jgi:hypothetical protein